MTGGNLLSGLEEELEGLRRLRITDNSLFFPTTYFAGLLNSYFEKSIEDENLSRELLKLAREKEKWPYVPKYAVPEVLYYLKHTYLTGWQEGRINSSHARLLNELVRAVIPDVYCEVEAQEGLEEELRQAAEDFGSEEIPLGEFRAVFKEFRKGSFVDRSFLEVIPVLYFYREGEDEIVQFPAISRSPKGKPIIFSFPIKFWSPIFERKSLSFFLKVGSEAFIDFPLRSRRYKGSLRAEFLTTLERENLPSGGEKIEIALVVVEFLP